MMGGPSSSLCKNELSFYRGKIEVGTGSTRNIIKISVFTYTPGSERK